MPKKYPGRDFVTQSDTAAKVLFDQRVGGTARFPCLNPLVRHGIGLPDLVKAGPVLPVTIPARCRQCRNCLAHRRNLWTARATDECAVAPRTWFGTLTVSPVERFKIELAADLLRPSGVSQEKWPAYKFGMLCNLAGREITRMFKRLRKSGCRFRYLLVAEAHKDGWPHFHLLVHETGPPIRKAVLDGQWPLGFTQWKLVGREPKAARYVCKYLAKTALTRVRASLRYGQASRLSRSTAALEGACAALTKIRDAQKPPSGKRATQNKE